MIKWHRLFGLTLIDYFEGKAFIVELEKDLSKNKQLLDVVILHKEAESFKDPLPDGLENLAKYNLISYKSLQEPLDDWTLKELTGHYVNYRKQESPSFQELLPEDEFQLYGICTRFPEKLKQQIQLVQVKKGIYDVVRGTDQIRVIVLSEIPKVSHNAIWHLFSGIPETVQYGAKHYHWYSKNNSTIMNQLYYKYGLEGVDMPYTMQDYYRDFTKENLNLLAPEERMEGLAPEERMEGLDPKDLITKLKQEGVSIEEIKKLLEGQP